MNAKEQKRKSKFLSLVLRHDPDHIGIELDSAGWTDVSTLLARSQKKGNLMDLNQLKWIVENNDKKRFEFNADGTMIRATQGHSVDVELDHPEATPPEFLYHGTPQQAVEPIQQTGLKPMQRHDVHLHEDPDLATNVGSRRGKPVLLRIDSGQMNEKGYTFYLTPNKVWLVDHVPPEFIDVV